MHQADEGGSTDGHPRPSFGAEIASTDPDRVPFEVSGLAEPVVEPDPGADPFREAVSPAVTAAALDGRRRSSRQLRPVPVALAALVIVVAAVGGILVLARGGSSAPGTGMTPAAFVVSSTQNTVAQRTADVVISGSVKAGGVTVPVSGTGQANFSTDQFSGSFDLQADGRALDEKELVTDGQAYLSMVIDGQSLSGLAGGADWIELPLPQQSAGSLGGADVDPLQGIHLAEERGAKVVPLGPSTIDGDAVSGYSVTPSSAEIARVLQQEEQSGQLPTSSDTSILQQVTALGGFDIDVYIDGSDLLKRETVTVGGSTSAVVSDLQMTFADYGTPVSIQAPAPGTVESLSQFQTALQNLRSAQS